MSHSLQPGTVAWFDLTVPEADSIRNFYQAIAGWQAEPVDMGGYQDYAMRTASGEPVAGICHRQGPNATLPGGWLIYITVPDLDMALERCRQFGGRVLSETRGAASQGLYAVIEDPAGSACGLFQPPPAEQ